MLIIKLPSWYGPTKSFYKSVYIAWGTKNQLQISKDPKPHKDPQKQRLTTNPNTHNKCKDLLPKKTTTTKNTRDVFSTGGAAPQISQWLYLAVPGCTRLYRAVPRSIWLYRTQPINGTGTGLGCKDLWMLVCTVVLIICIPAIFDTSQHFNQAKPTLKNVSSYVEVSNCEEGFVTEIDLRLW